MCQQCWYHETVTSMQKICYNCEVIVVALCNRIDHYIFILWFLLLSFFFFPRLISAVAEWMSAIFAHMVWP